MFENFSVTVQGHAKDKQLAELAVLLHRPNCKLDIRQFYVRLVTRDWDHDSTRDTSVNVRYDNCRGEVMHYPLLHFYGETGWGSQTRDDAETKHSCSMRDYL
eukprot:487088-Rhodomonas_salina.1